MKDYLDPTTQLGEFISKTLQIKSVLGEGTFAVVFLAEDTVTRKKYAVKCLYKQGLSKKQLDIQYEEILFMKKVAGHPNIINIVDYVETPHYRYMVLDHCDRDLFDYILNEKMDESKVRKIFLQLTSAVAHCHEQGVFHRDLKPENILVLENNIKLCDFGLATTDDLSSDFGCGSACYLSPEARGEDSIPLSYHPAANDVWSLGVILINLLTAKNPWNQASDTDKHFLHHIYTKSPQDTFQEKFGFSPQICKLLRTIFHLDPFCRPTVSQLHASFSEISGYFCHSIPVKYLPLTPVSPDEHTFFPERFTKSPSKQLSTDSYEEKIKPSVDSESTIFEMEL
ncbi:hypothetical protein HK103_006128 [Boothiomyces macroporosus]|uniref:Protein kinase domain-containing protein n=1 Tax=Boothiomyces macroporosus TaxID=261099 RepID=A0AAD5UEV4_9FUNG|nr:hypothetical protein HK103_006128 [Boothiomyces macroporosus]